MITSGFSLSSSGDDTIGKSAYVSVFISIPAMTLQSSLAEITLFITFPIFPLAPLITIFVISIIPYLSNPFALSSAEIFARFECGFVWYVYCDCDTTGKEG